MRYLTSLALFLCSIVLLGNNKLVVDSPGVPSVKQTLLPVTVNNQYFSLEDFADFKAEAKALGYMSAHFDLYNQLFQSSIPELYVGGTLDGSLPLYFAREITSDAMIDPNPNVTFEATRCITLQTGFHAKPGSNFTARIVPLCETEANAKSLLDSHQGNRNN